MFPDDVDFAFVARDALADSDHQPAKFGNLIGEAVETLVLCVETLVDGLEMLADQPVLVVETLVDRCEELADEPVLRVEALGNQVE